MFVPNINVVKGEDPSVLTDGPDPNDPSGLERLGFGDAEFRLLAEYVRSVFLELLSHMPVELAEHMPPRIPLYGRKTPGLEKTVASTRYDVRGECGATPPFVGIILQCTPDEVSGKSSLLRKIVGHEAIHVATAPGVHCAKSVSESFAATLEKECFPDPSDLRMSRDWDGDAFVGSTGLRTDDFAWLARDRVYEEALYLSTAHALQHFTATAIWQVCTRLVRQAKETGRSPRFDHVRDALLDEDQAAGEKALNSLPFRPLEPGTHQCVFPKARNGAYVYTFSVTPNPRYSPSIRDNEHAVQCACQGSDGRFRLEYKGSSIAKPITTYWNLLPPSHAFDFSELANIAAGRGLCRAGAVEEIHCQTDRWKFRLRPPRTEAVQPE